MLLDRAVRIWGVVDLLGFGYAVVMIASGQSQPLSVGWTNALSTARAMDSFVPYVVFLAGFGVLVTLPLSGWGLWSLRRWGGWLGLAQLPLRAVTYPSLFVLPLLQHLVALSAGIWIGSAILVEGLRGATLGAWLLRSRNSERSRRG